VVVEPVAIDPLFTKQIAHLTNGCRNRYELHCEPDAVLGLPALEPVEPVVRFADLSSELVQLVTQLVQLVTQLMASLAHFIADLDEDLGAQKSPRGPFAFFDAMLER
jgi:hypothetical protein